MMFSKKNQNKTYLLLSLCIGTIFLSGCELTQNYLNHDRTQNMQEQDYRDALAPRQTEIDPLADGKLSDNIPDLIPYVSQPNGNYATMPLVSVAVNGTIPLRDVLYEIAEQAQYDIELDPRIKGSIIFTARNRPLDMVIDRISNIAGLRYNFDNDMLRIELDTPYHEIYKINYLALTRTNSSSVNNDISVVSGEGADAGSAFSVTNESSSDFWSELETNLTQILESNKDSNRLATTEDPTEPLDDLIMDADGNISNEPLAAPQAVLNVNSLPADGEQESSAGGEDNDPFASRYSINKQAGLVSVFAPERIHKVLNEYMSELKKSVSAQVLVEAKVLEVTLNDRFAAGIDWSVAFDSSGAIGFDSIGGGLVRGLLDNEESLTSNAALGFSRANLDFGVEALAQFGTVKALASPRLTVLNNQSAVLNVVENVVFFEVEVEVEDGEDGEPPVLAIDTDAKTVPEGVLINVQPAIDLENQSISMAIRPTITNVVRFEEDPNPLLAVADTVSPVPVVNVQEFDSIINVNNGQAVVLGGLLQDRVLSTRNSVPIAGELPVVGALFRNQTDRVTKTELVVFLKATIVNGNSATHGTDKDLYRTFSGDRRPFKL